MSPEKRIVGVAHAGLGVAVHDSYGYFRRSCSSGRRRESDSSDELPLASVAYNKPSVDYSTRDKPQKMEEDYWLCYQGPNLPARSLSQIGTSPRSADNVAATATTSHEIDALRGDNASPVPSSLSSIPSLTQEASRGKSSKLSFVVPSPASDLADLEPESEPEIEQCQRKRSLRHIQPRKKLKRSSAHKPVYPRPRLLLGYFRTKYPCFYCKRDNVPCYVALDETDGPCLYAPCQNNGPSRCCGHQRVIKPSLEKGSTLQGQLDYRLRKVLMAKNHAKCHEKDENGLWLDWRPIRMDVRNQRSSEDWKTISAILDPTLWDELNPPPAHRVQEESEEDELSEASDYDVDEYLNRCPENEGVIAAPVPASQPDKPNASKAEEQEEGCSRLEIFLATRPMTLSGLQQRRQEMSVIRSQLEGEAASVQKKLQENIGLLDNEEVIVDKLIRRREIANSSVGQDDPSLSYLL